MPSHASPDLRARIKQEMREQIRLKAIELMLESGFAETSVDDIVNAAGVSRRSFYRYFGTREDLVLGRTDEQIATLVDALTARPADEDPWLALQRAAESLPDAAQPTERALAFTRLVNGDPVLRARHLEQRAAWRAALAPVIERRLRRPGAEPDQLAATALVAAALSCLDVAVEEWVRRGGSTPLPDLYERAVAAVRGR
ncbi:TetR/AcrR family transcriptional regulator [Actinoplanes sp. NPDC049265]|uniref:TetR/AcrR family transcriptional regulator n=1 Tax=Actinoplanes sp. NPDC049265 TaxID=3363902 RepID=UPI00371AAB1A